MDEQADLGLDSVSLPTKSMESSLFAQLPDLQAASAIGCGGGAGQGSLGYHRPKKWVITLGPCGQYCSQLPGVDIQVGN